jgi:hypothetical protein
MNRWLALATFALAILTAPASAAGLTGRYVEARTADVWTGPCFANAEMNLGGKQAVLGWKVEQGSLGNVSLDGLSIVAVVATSDTLGLEQTAPSKAVLIVDEKASPAQRDALIQLAKEQGGKLVAHVLAVRSAAVDLTVGQCKDGGCARLQAGGATLTTRCLNHHDTVCGNESAYYPPLAKDVKAEAAMAVEFGYNGKGLNESWQEAQRRGAYVGTFSLR